MKNKILLEIAKFCENCSSNCCCPEDECILYRIEKILLEKKEKKKK